jgi:nucleotide-binding universal stress UspA family protein
MTAQTRARRRSRPITAPRSNENRILVAAAGDRESLGALRLAAALAERDKAKVMLLGVSTPFPHNVSTLVSMRQPVAIDEVSRRAVLEDVEDSVRQIPGADQWTKRAVVGFTADVISQTAATWQASMILLGIGPQGRIKRLLSHGTAVDVMRRARVPVLAVHPSATTLPTHAMAAVDFTAASTTSALLAARLLGDGGTLTVAHACAFGNAEPREGDLVDLYRAGARAKLEEVVRDLRRRTRHRVESVMLKGDPAKAILAYARETNCDLIALGGHELGLMDRILLGSVRTQILRGARCSVLIAPPKTLSPRGGRS